MTSEELKLVRQIVTTSSAETARLWDADLSQEAVTVRLPSGLNMALH